MNDIAIFTLVENMGYTYPNLTPQQWLAVVRKAVRNSEEKHVKKLVDLASQIKLDHEMQDTLYP